MLLLYIASVFCTMLLEYSPLFPVSLCYIILQHICSTKINIFSIHYDSIITTFDVKKPVSQFLLFLTLVAMRKEFAPSFLRSVPHTYISKKKKKNTLDPC